MKKKLLLSILCFVFVLIVATGCGNKIHEITTKVENTFDSLYTIERLEVVSKVEGGSSNVVRKMKADNMDFYLYTYNEGNGLTGNDYIYTTILSSVYKKYETQIKNSAINYGIDINYETEKLYWLKKCESCEGVSVLKINANSYQTNELNNFIKDILNITEIKELYKIWLNTKTYEYYVDDDSKIIINGDNSSTSIFEYYKNIQ